MEEEEEEACSTIVFMAYVPLRYQSSMPDCTCIECGRSFTARSTSQLAILFCFMSTEANEGISFNIVRVHLCCRCSAMGKEISKLPEYPLLDNFDVGLAHHMKSQLDEFRPARRCVHCPSCRRITHHGVCPTESCRRASYFKYCESCGTACKHKKRDACTACGHRFEEANDISYKSYFYQLLDHLKKVNMYSAILCGVCTTCNQLLGRKRGYVCPKCYTHLYCRKGCKRKHKCQPWQRLWDSYHIMVERYWEDDSYVYIQNGRDLVQIKGHWKLLRLTESLQ